MSSVPVAVFLDESRRERYHPILSVGGFVVEYADVPTLESAWMNAKGALGLRSDEALRYAMTWQDPADRRRIIEQIPHLGVEIKAIVALLEDFRPETLLQAKATRKDMFIQRRAFEYVLQRLPEQSYVGADAPGPHVVFADRHDDFRCYDEEYAKAWSDGWSFPMYGRTVPPLREIGFISSAAAMSGGPAMEIADLIGSVAVRWTEAMAAAERGKVVPDLSELETAMRALLPLFPGRVSWPKSWRGYSFIAHREGRTGREIIYDRIDGWLRDLGGEEALRIRREA